jgi:hypothetical protein
LTPWGKNQKPSSQKTKKRIKTNRIKNIKFLEDLPMIIPRQFGFNYPSGFREEAF